MTSARRLGAAALLAGGLAPLCAVAQDWGTIGAWEQVSGTQGVPPALAYRKPVTVSGAFVAITNNTLSGNMAAAAWDYFANTWVTWPDISGVQPSDPYSFAVGGTVCVIDETAMSTLYCIDSANTGLGWAPVAIAGGYAVARAGQRFLAFGSSLYAIGGVDLADPVVFHNDVWAVDVTSALAKVAPAPTWTQVTPDGAAGAAPPRVGYSLSESAGGLVMFGGVSVDGSPTFLPFNCFQPAYAPRCTFHQHVWFLAPGLRGQPAPGSLPGTAWSYLASSGAYGGPLPPGRFDHTAGMSGDQLFVFGGTGAAGTLSDMWAWNSQSRTWQAVQQTAPWPPAASDIGYGVGLVWPLGRHLVQYVQAVDASGNPAPGGGQLWRWAPVASAGGGPGPAAPADAPHPGVVAGLAIGGLLGVANLALLLALAVNAGLVSVPCGGGGGAPGWRRGGGGGAGAGYYTAASAGGDAYAPPVA